MSMPACRPGANDESNEPTSSLPSMPSDETQVLPSASMHLPPVQAVANELQSSLVMQAAHSWSLTRPASCPLSCVTSCPTTNDLIGPKLAMVHKKSPGCDFRSSIDAS